MVHVSDYRLRAMGYGLWTIDHGLWTIDYGLWTPHKHRTKNISTPALNIY